MISILDLRGNVIHSLHQGEDREGGKTPLGAKLNTVGHCLDNFITNYLLPATEGSRLNEIIAVRDSGNEFRKSIYPEYKANRDKKPTEPEMSQRVNECQDAVFVLLKGLGIPVVDAAGIEADDIIGYLVKYLPGPHMIYTVDQDMIQLASQTCGVMIKNKFSAHFELYNSASPKVKLMDVEPRHVALCKSIVGDSSDNYGGVKGMGPKAFLELFEAFDLDGLDDLCTIVDTDDFNGALKQAIDATGNKHLQTLYNSSAQWKLGWRLANLNPSLIGARQGNKFNLLRWTKRVPNPDMTKALLTQHGCWHLLPKLESFLPTQTLVTADNMSDDAVAWIESEFKKSPFISLDWETSDQLQNPAFKEAANGKEFVDMLSSTITGAGFTFGDNLQHTIYLSFDHADTNNLDRNVLLDIVGAIPEDKMVAIQNTAFEINLFKNTTGYSIANVVDTKVMASHVDENMTSGLKERSKHHLNYNQIRYEDVIEKGKRMCDYSAEHVFKYGADDPLVTAHLFDWYRMVMQIEGSWEFFLENENLPIEVLSDGFLAGVTMDWEELDRQAAEDKAELESSMTRLRELILANQTDESLVSGVDRLFEEGLEEVKAKARIDFDKSIEGEEATDEMTYSFRLDAFIEQKLDSYRNKLINLIKYEPFEVIEKPKEFEMTVTALKPVLAALGLPAITAEILKNQSTTATWAEAAREDLHASSPASLFLDLLVPAVAYNDTAKGKVAKGEGRAHPVYQSFRNFGLQYVEAKTETTGSELNLGSPVQMKALLYGMLDLPIRLRGFEVSKTREALGLNTPTAQANEDAIITALAEDCGEASWKKEALEALLRAKKCSTRISMFYDKYPLWRHPIDDMIHPQVNSCGTETRRPTGSSPNALQWPKKGEGVKFRRCILPNAKLGHDLIVSIDWSQQELRVAGALSMDEALLDCYIGKDVEHVLSPAVKALLGPERLAKFLGTNTKDVHTQTATSLLKMPYEDVVAALEGDDKDLVKKAKGGRTAAKPINFGGTYGIGAAKIARQLICPVEEAKQYLADKKALYWKFEEYRQDVIDMMEKHGYIATTFGSRRHVHAEIVTSDDKERSSVHRQGVNFTIQGVCADNLKRTLTEIYRQGILTRTGAVLVAPIYDEVVFSVNHTFVVDLIMSVHAIMTRDIPGMSVPMLAEPSLGINFGDQIEIGRFPTPEAIQQAVNEALGVKRRLLYHAESESLFEEVLSDKAYKSMLSNTPEELLDVTDLPEFEARFAAEAKQQAA